VHRPENNAIAIMNDDPRGTKFRFVKRFEGELGEDELARHRSIKSPFASVS